MYKYIFKLLFSNFLQEIAVLQWQHAFFFFSNIISTFQDFVIFFFCKQNHWFFGATLKYFQGILNKKIYISKKDEET